MPLKFLQEAIRSVLILEASPNAWLYAKLYVALSKASKGGRAEIRADNFVNNHA